MSALNRHCQQLSSVFFQQTKKKKKKRDSCKLNHFHKWRSLTLMSASFRAISLVWVSCCFFFHFLFSFLFCICARYSMFIVFFFLSNLSKQYHNGNFFLLMYACVVFVETVKLYQWQNEWMDEWVHNMFFFFLVDDW